MEATALTPQELAAKVKREFHEELFPFLAGAGKVNQKLCDFSTMERSGTIELRPLFGNDKVTRDGYYNPPKNIHFKCHKNHKTNEWIGVPSGLTDKGDFIWKMLHIENCARIFHLEFLNDAIDWHVLKHQERIKGSQFSGAVTSWMYIHNEEQVAKEFNDKRTLIRRATDYIDNLSGNDLVDFSRTLGINPADVSHDVIRKQLYEIAEDRKSVMKIISKIEGGEDQLILIEVQRAKEVGLITYDNVNGWMYKGGVPLGSTDQGIITTLKKELAMYKNIVEEARGLDKTRVQGLPNGAMTDAEIRNVAKDLGVKGWHLKSIANLEKEIKDAKALLV